MAPAEDITVDAAVFAVRPDSDTTGESFAVRTAQRVAATRALERVELRFIRVDGDDGRELDEGDPEIEDLLTTPNWVSRVSQPFAGPTVHLDCKAYIGDEQGAAYLRIVKDELRREGVERARIVDPERWAPTDSDADETIEFVPSPRAAFTTQMMVQLLRALPAALPPGSNLRLPFASDGLLAFAREHACAGSAENFGPFQIRLEPGVVERFVEAWVEKPYPAGFSVEHGETMLLGIEGAAIDASTYGFAAWHHRSLQPEARALLAGALTPT